MTNRITPSVKELVGKSDDELREVLIDLNKQSLLKLCRESIQSVEDYAEHVEYLKEENNLLYGRLNNIIALVEKEIK